MTPTVPKNPASLMLAVYRKIFPAVKRELDHWKKLALQIPDGELRKQALASMKAKRFHCQGGAVFALLAGERWREAVRFIVAYQTISDYLDNLCDRSTSLDPKDFRLLHESMQDALTIAAPLHKNYYSYRQEQQDGGYLQELAKTCQVVIAKINHYDDIEQPVAMLASLYTDLQVHKHVQLDERLPRLLTWHKQYEHLAPDLTWYEFAAASGSTLGIFNYVAYALGERKGKEFLPYIWKGYFPYVQALHILLDYYIDQKEDEAEGDLNFCSFYPDRLTMARRFQYMINCGEERIMHLPDATFHKMVIQGLIGLYLGDQKTTELPGSEKMKRMLFLCSGTGARFFHWNTKVYYSMR